MWKANTHFSTLVGHERPKDDLVSLLVVLLSAVSKGEIGFICGLAAPRSIVLPANLI